MPDETLQDNSIENKETVESTENTAAVLHIENIENENNEQITVIENEKHEETVTEKVLKTEKAENESGKTKKRFSMTVNFTSENEFKHVDKIVQERIAAGATINYNHFLRQCIDFTINHGKVFGKQYFGIPEHEHKLLKDAYFTTEESKIPTIK